MASGPITSWEIDGETVETVSDFILGDSKITADGDCSHEIKRRRGRSQDGGGLGRGDHFLSYKFIKRTIERRANFTKQLLIAR